MILTITEEMKKKIEHWWKKPISELTDVDAITIVEEFVDSTTDVKDASFLTDDEIIYTLEEEEDAGEYCIGYRIRNPKSQIFRLGLRQGGESLHTLIFIKKSNLI